MRNIPLDFVLRLVSTGNSLQFVRRVKERTFMSWAQIYRNYARANLSYPASN
jgi:hypothetical protein